MLFCTGCDKKDAANEHNQAKSIVIAGSTTILPVSESWAQLFRDQTDIIVNVQGGGSTNGINLVRENRISLGASSRDLNHDEHENVQIIPLGRDALAVIVNTSNPIENITTEQLQQIFSGEVRNWSTFGGPDAKIQFINRESGSGTRSCFEKTIMCGGNKSECVEMSLHALVLNSNAEVKKSVELIKNSIGYISYGFLDEKIRPLKLNNIAITLDNIDAGKYTLARSLLYLRHIQNKSPKVDQYLEFIKTDAAKEVLLSEGFIPAN